MLSDLLRALHLIPRRRRWQWVVLVPLALAAAALESVGAGVVLTLGTVVAEPSRVGSLPLVSRMAAWLPSTEPTQLIVTVGVGVIVFYLLRGVLLTTFAWLQEAIAQRTAAEVAGQLLGAYLTAPYIFHLRRNSGKLIQTVTQSVEAVLGSGLASAINIATEALTLTGLVGVLAVAAPLATLVSLVTIGVVLLAPLFVIRRLAPRYGAGIKSSYESQQQDLQQSLALFKEVRVMGVEEYFQTAFIAHRNQLARLRARQGALTTGIRLSVETTFVVAILLAIIVLTVRGASTGSLIGLMALYAYVGFRVVPSANRLMLGFAIFQGARPHINGLDADLDLLRQSESNATTASDAVLLPFTDRIVLEAISYSYERGRMSALDGVTLTIRRGESIGIVGPTGSGKSTLIDVLLGLLLPQSGRVLIDGRDVRGNERSWQQHIGYVPQAFALLDDTIRRNVAFGQPDAQIDDAKVQHALRLAHLSETVASLPEKIDTTIGERGARLSGGERQRIAIARALYNDPDVLVFDEATSALDYQTENAIVRAIDELRGIKTLVVVAHRLSTVRNCDRLVFLQNGRVTGEGRYDDLIAVHPALRDMMVSGAVS